MADTAKKTRFGPSLVCPSKCKKLANKSLKKSRLIEGGLELPKQVIFKDWEPGGEYTVSIVLKNVRLDTQKIHFQLSNSQFSTPVCSQSLYLCSGTSHTLPITFRPCEKHKYEESIEFQTSGGHQIKVPILAVLPCPTLSLPDQLRFGKCAVQESISVDFDMSNTGNIPTNFSWEVPQGFSIQPRSGLLFPKEGCKFTAIFSPMFARVYNSSALCSFSDKSEPSYAKEFNYVSSKLMKLEGIGKFVHLSAKPCLGSEESGLASGSKVLAAGEFESFSLDFGSIAVGRYLDKFVKITNTSQVACHFSMHPYDEPSAESLSMFTCDEEDQTLLPHSSITMKVTYAPQALNPHEQCRYFIIEAQGSCGSIKFKCTGKSEGPRVVVVNGGSLIDFGSVRCGQSSHGVLHLTNLSDIPTIFQIQSSASSVFGCSELGGVIDARTSQAIPVKFEPTTPIPYCRIVYVIVQHQEPLLVYFIGNGFSEVQTPAVVEPDSISRYLEHTLSGISLLPPRKLKELIDQELLVADPDSGVLRLCAESDDEPFLPQPEKFSCSSSSNFSRYFGCHNEMSMVQHVTADVDTIKFDYCSQSLSSDGKNVTITNHTQGEVQCVWITRSLKHFVIMPTERNILPNKSASFTLYFKPDQANQFYNNELECFVYYADLNDYHHVHPLTVCPPWCVTVNLSGHTFTKGFTYSWSKQASDCTRLYLPSTTPEQPVFQTVVLTNTGKSSTMYDISDDTNSIFSAMPTHGIIKDQHQLVVLQMLPKESQVYRHALEYQLRSPATSYVKKVYLIGSCEVPKLSIQNDLYFRQTCSGSSSEQFCHVTNLSQFPIRFEWKLPGSERKTFVVEPSKGVISPSEIQVQKWYFCPSQVKHYDKRAFLFSSFVHTTKDAAKCKAPLDLHGMGETGLLQCTPSSIDFGSMVVESCVTHHFTLTNSGSCDLKYALSVRERAGSSSLKRTIELTPNRGVVYARSSQAFRVRVKPKKNGRFYCSLKYRLMSIHNNGQIEDESILYDLAEIKFLAAYPCLNVTDVVGRGRLNHISKQNLWEMFCIEEINAGLHDNPSDLELRYAISTRHSMRRKMPVLTKTVVDCYYGVAAINSESSVVRLKMKNDGFVPTKWAFQMPTDVWLQPESWADNEELNETEEHESFVLKNQLFTVSPARGCLLPGQRVTATLTYKHSHVGIHKLPVLLKIEMGREILLVWNGTTVEKGKPYLYMNPKDRFLNPVPIGSQAYFKQIVPLYNGGDTKAEYEVGMEAFQTLASVNYHMPLVECVQTRGTIEPGERLLLEFIFSPIEAMKYSIDVPIFLSMGDTISISLVGEGDVPSTVELSRGDAKYDHVPTSDCIVDDKQVACLSEDRLDYHTLPQFAVIQRIVFISNKSSHTLSYSWTAESDELNKIMAVEPVKGYIQPGRVAACKVNFFGHQSPCSYTFDLICNVFDESELEVYEASMRKWRKMQEEQKQSIIISHEGHRFFKTEVYDSEEVQGKDTTASETVSKPQQTYKEWQKMDLSKRSKKRPAAFTKTVKDAPPVKPKPLLLYVNVRATVLSILDYTKLCGSLEDFFIDYSLLAPKESNILAIKKEELTCLNLVLNQALREMLDDDNFRTSLAKLKDEPMQYFNQFSSKPNSTSITPVSKNEGTDLTAGKPLSALTTKKPPVTLTWKHEDSNDEPSGKPLGHVVSERSEIVHQSDSEEGDSNTALPLPTCSNNKLTDQMGIQSVMEGIVEETLRNILTEISSSELTVNMANCNILTF